eukprot:NODE_236_length_11993_cov_1.471078.p5 type:complete len:209 gc:universal NODE_236_length_11993_cov_1.471078:2295-1669(-)
MILFWLCWTIKVSTFNLENFDATESNFATKLNDFTTLINQEQPHVISLQEITSPVVTSDLLKSKLNGKIEKWDYLYQKGIGQHTNAVFYQKSLFKPIYGTQSRAILKPRPIGNDKKVAKMNNIFKVQEPEVIPLSGLDRGGLVVPFIDLSTTQIFQVISVHLKSPRNSIGHLALTNLAEIIKYISYHRDKSFILAGDMNMDPNDFKWH